MCPDINLYHTSTPDVSLLQKCVLRNKILTENQIKPFQVSLHTCQFRLIVLVFFKLKLISLLQGGKDG
jgi:hypothetical protein